MPSIAPVGPAMPPADPAYDQVVDRLLARRVILAGGYLDDRTAERIAAQLMLLDATGDGPITLRLSCPDGDLPAVLLLADTLGLVGVPVEALCLGEVGGAAVGVLAAADRRVAAFHAVIRLAEPRAGLSGRAGELVDRAREHHRELRALHELIASAAGRPVDEVAADLRAVRYLDAAGAVAYGLIDAIQPPAALRR